MKKTDYDYIVGLLNKKQEIETFKAWFNSTNPNQQGMSVSWYIINAQMNGSNNTAFGVADGHAGNCPHWGYNHKYTAITSELTTIFAHWEAVANRLEQELASLTQSVSSLRSSEASWRGWRNGETANLKTAQSKHKELNLKINKAKSEASVLASEKAAITKKKMDTLDSMDDSQKFFVLSKAKSYNQDVIIDLILGSGFDEQAYIDRQSHQEDEVKASGDHDDVPDVLS